MDSVLAVPLGLCIALVGLAIWSVARTWAWWRATRRPRQVDPPERVPVWTHRATGRPLVEADEPADTEDSLLAVPKHRRN